MTEFQMNLTDIKHDEVSLHGHWMLNKTHEGGPSNTNFWEGKVILDFGLPSMRKFLNDDLSGMQKISKGH